MTHSIEELQRQYDAAQSRAIAAKRAEMEALTRLNEAKCAAKLAEFEAMGGVVGVTRVRAKDRWAWGKGDVADMTKGPFFVIGAYVEYNLTWFRLAKIKKDGTPSAAPSGADCETVFILPEDQK